ncbi:dnaJ homolog subfamily B member 6 isoform X2 [Jatropha curcas]|uniref:dnaJ homolog subfamily B member 6 isoform X2 n=1 Tax=Jatropha curcas TaxID=180498 RepID=UPI0005FABB22|nr:dnaJ homolog subfamily B member 6 isoform X2 [Jatropha curcas]
MANGKDESKSKDFYQVLGLNKECTATELKNAYRKLALRWHPDRCSASGNSKFVEEAKQNFQAIQQAYSVLSDANKRFLYDVGAYDSDDDENGMGDFLNEMAVMMSQTKPNENGEESFEDLQVLFEEMFQEDIESFGVGYEAAAAANNSSPYMSKFSESSSSNHNRNSSKMKNLVESKAEDSLGFGSHFQKFCVGTGGTPKKFQEAEGSKRRNSRRSRR